LIVAAMVILDNAESEIYKKAEFRNFRDRAVALKLKRDKFSAEVLDLQHLLGKAETNDEARYESLKHLYDHGKSLEADLHVFVNDYNELVKTVNARVDTAHTTANGIIISAIVLTAFAAATAPVSVPAVVGGGAVSVSIGVWLKLTAYFNKKKELKPENTGGIQQDLSINDVQCVLNQIRLMMKTPRENDHANMEKIFVCDSRYY